MACINCRTRLAVYAKFQSCNIEYCASCVPLKLIAPVNEILKMDSKIAINYYINTTKHTWASSDHKKQLIKCFSRIYDVEASGICCWNHNFIHLHTQNVSIIVEWGQKTDIKPECVFLHKNLKDKILYLYIHFVSYDVDIVLYGTIYNLAKTHINKYFINKLTDDPLTICEITL